jgi:hypothetical protein
MMASIEQCRGIESVECNDRLVLVKAPIQKVAPAFVQLKQATVWQQDVYDREIEILKKDFIVFQFQGHSWTPIHYLRSFANTPREGEAEELARCLDTEAIYYDLSDTGIRISYRLYESTGLIESFSFNDGSCQFHSKRRKLSSESIGEPYTFIINFMEENDIYIPQGILPEVAVGEKLILQIETHIESLPDRRTPGRIGYPILFQRSDFSRLDYVGIAESC